MFLNPDTNHPDTWARSRNDKTQTDPATKILTQEGMKKNPESQS